MRIRSIHPSFWASEDVAALDWETRLVFIGLWSYVDDNGVGRDNERLIAAALFPLDDDPRESLARVSRGCRTLFERGQIQRYEVDGKPLLFVAAWDKWQKVDKPAGQRYERPTSANATIRESVATPSRHLRETLAPGEGEKGRRGEEKVSTTQVGSEPPVSSATPSQTIQEEPRGPVVDPTPYRIAKPYCDAVGVTDRTKITNVVKGAMGKYTPEAIAAALDRLKGKPELVLTLDVLRREVEGEAKRRPRITRDADGARRMGDDW